MHHATHRGVGGSGAGSQALSVIVKFVWMERWWSLSRRTSKDFYTSTILRLVSELAIELHAC